MRQTFVLINSSKILAGQPDSHKSCKFSWKTGQLAERQQVFGLWVGLIKKVRQQSKDRAQTLYNSLSCESEVIGEGGFMQQSVNFLDQSTSHEPPITQPSPTTHWPLQLIGRPLITAHHHPPKWVSGRIELFVRRVFYELRLEPWRKSKDR